MLPIPLSHDAVAVADRRGSTMQADSLLRDYLRDPAGAISAVLGHLQAWLSAWGAAMGSAAAAAAAAGYLLREYRRRQRARDLACEARMVAILPPPAVEPEGAAALWANLVGLLRPAWRRWLWGQPHLTWEYRFDSDGVRIGLWVPGGIPPGLVERALEAAWPGAHTRTRPATAPLPPGTGEGDHLYAAAGELRLARSEALPIRADFPTDPIRALLGAPVGLTGGEQAVVQILARPITGHRIAAARRAARRLRAGRPARLVHRLLDVVTPGRIRAPRRSPAAVPGDRQAAIETAAQDRAIVLKQRGAQYETRIRYAVLAPADDSDKSTRQHAEDRLRGRAHAIASAFSAYTEHNYYRRRRIRRPLPRLADRRLDRGDLLSIPELAALAHLPWDHTVAGLQRASAKAVPPPPGLPGRGPAIRPIGQTDTGRTRHVGLHVPDARQHLHILGATGSGKSELLGTMILADAEAGRGVVAVDPKGDLITDLLMRLPEQLAPRVVLFDADDRHPPPILNPLEGTDGPRAVDHLVSIFSRIYAASWGPRTDDILRSGLLTLHAQPGTPTLSDLPHLFTNQAYRHSAITHIHDDILRGFWTWYDDLSTAGRAHVTAPLMNKLRGLLLRPFVRDALAGGPSTVDMDHVLGGGICLVRIAKDTLGAETSALVGSIVVARTWQAATRRARLPQDKRPDCALYLDEAHNFLHLPYALEDMLAEARGYRLSMTLAHQYLRQLPKELEEGISTNARTKIFFNSSPEDAHHLARHTAPCLDEHDLSHLGAFHIAVRPVLHGAEAPAFTARTQKLPPPAPGRARLIRTAARRHAGPRHGITLTKRLPLHRTTDPRRTPPAHTGDK
ncbi:type IV secretory system conjugative DNA transfer family protein [Streptomyces boninensis]|uniref:type IV secretory system conjugative DNA transfer family protein n=1 Tax=Streptomyces boninensis TaxID=2039455 RepID=UPI003B217833